MLKSKTEILWLLGNLVAAIVLTLLVNGGNFELSFNLHDTYFVSSISILALVFLLLFVSLSYSFRLLFNRNLNRSAKVVLVISNTLLAVLSSALIVLSNNFFNPLNWTPDSPEHMQNADTALMHFTTNPLLPFLVAFLLLVVISTAYASFSLIRHKKI